jgi:hypothetical protein
MSVFPFFFFSSFFFEDESDRCQTLQQYQYTKVYRVQESMGEEGKFERLASRGCEYILPRVTDTHFTPNVSKYITTNEN